MSKLDSKPLHQAQHSKSSHDLNHTFDFTSSTGMILPIAEDILYPGESIDCKVDLSQTRTQPLDSAAYLDLDLHVDYFFVPLTLLCSKFESFIYRIKDFYSSAENTRFGLPLFDLDIFKQNIEANGNSRESATILGLDFDDWAKGTLRLFDHLGYGTLFNSASPNYTSDSCYNPQIFPWALLAYNAAYEYYYINDEFEDFNNKVFNVDANVNAGTNIDVGLSAGQVHALVGLKYRNKYHDYFTRLKASPIVSGRNLLDSAGSLNLAKSWLSRGSLLNQAGVDVNVIRDGFRGAATDTYGNDSPNSFNQTEPRTGFGFSSVKTADPVAGQDFSNGLDINTANLRALFANEKLWTITGMNRKQYDAQTLAHFGFDVPTDVMHQVQHIGHHLYNVKVGEVISTAGTANQPLATVAGKGYAFDNNDNPIRFTAPCHGVFIALYSSAIHRNYFGTFRKENAIAGWQDFYQPEFDNLGMQPVFMFETLQDKFGTIGTISYGDIIGWQYRYEQFKSRYDRSTFAFANRFLGSGNVQYTGPFGSWSPASLPFKGFNVGAMTFATPNYWSLLLKENPSELNNLMSVSYDPRWYSGASGETLNYLETPWLAYQTDPLIHHGLIHYTKLSTMSTYSMPKLND